MSLSSILCSWIQLTEMNKTWNFEENRFWKLNDSLSSKTMIVSSLFSSSRLIFSLKTMIVRAVYHYSYELESTLFSIKHQIWFYCTFYVTSYWTFYMIFYLINFFIDFFINFFSTYIKLCKYLLFDQQWNSSVHNADYEFTV